MRVLPWKIGTEWWFTQRTMNMDEHTFLCCTDKWWILNSRCIFWSLLQFNFTVVSLKSLKSLKAHATFRGHPWTQRGPHISLRGAVTRPWRWRRWPRTSRPSNTCRWRWRPIGSSPWRRWSKAHGSSRASRRTSRRIARRGRSRKHGIRTSFGCHPSRLLYR